MKIWGCLIVVLGFALSCRQNENDEVTKSTAKLEYVDQLKDLIRQYPDSAGLRMQLVNSYDSLKMYKEAISQTDSLIKRDSLSNGLWFTKGQLQEDNKDTAAAVDSYTKAIKV